jgi:hypothetical protein
MGSNLSSYQIAEELDLDRGDAQAMTTTLRQGNVERRPEPTPASEVECDEIHVTAGHKGNPEAEKRARVGRRRRLNGERIRGTLAKEKPPIFGMLHRGGEVVIRMPEDVKRVTIGPLIERTIAVGSVVYTDEYDIYSRLKDWAITTRRSATRRGSSPATTGTVPARCMSTPWRGSGRCCVPGSVRIGDLAGEVAAVPGLLRVRAQRSGAWQSVVGGVDRTLGLIPPDPNLSVLFSSRLAGAPRCPSAGLSRQSVTPNRPGCRFDRGAFSITRSNRRRRG